MLKQLLGNTTLLVLFLGLLALPFGTFYLFRAPSIKATNVLSATDGAYGGQLKLGKATQPLLLQEVTATAFSNQKAGYSDVFLITNSQTTPKTFRINVIHQTILSGIVSNWSFKNGQSEITLGAGESTGTSLDITSTSASSTVSVTYLVSIE